MTDQNIPVLEGWQTEEPIGKGGFGTVYRIRREESFGVKEVSALKELAIPQDENEVRVLRASGMDDRSISQQFSDQVQDIVREYKLMIELKNCPNIVHCHDFQVIPQGLGFQVLLRMELLTPLTAELGKGILNSQQTLLKLGSDMCNALQVCHDKGILHRDVKPQNIFLAPDGNFKLGDFGIARTIEKNVQATSGIGTYNYMAPEVFNNHPYDSRADIYSLGMVLYNLLNGNRGPFLPPAPAPLTAELLSQARNRRFSGEPLPPPAGGSEALKAIVLKACAFQPRHRYRTAAQLKQDLDALAQGREDCLIALHPDLQEPEEEPAAEAFDEDKTIVDGSGKAPRRAKWLPAILAGAAALALAAGGLLLANRQEAPAETIPETTLPIVTTEPTPVLEAPTLSHTPGRYDQRLSLSLSHPDPEAEIHYALEASNYASNTFRRQEDTLYQKPISLFRGNTTLTVYAKKGDLVSDTVDAVFTLSYPAEEVTFQERGIEKLVRDELEMPTGTITTHDCEEITFLSWYDLDSSYQVTSLDDLQYLPRLTSINIYDQRRLSDLSGLQHCQELEDLYLSSCKLENLDFLENAPGLTAFSTYECGISDISGLAHLTRLEELSLKKENVSYDSLLSGGALPNLTTLEMSGTQLTDYPLLSGLESLESLTITKLKGTDFAALGQLTGLKKLKLEPDRYAYDEEVPQDYTFLETMTALEHLSLDYIFYDSSQLTHLYGLSNLKALSLNSCYATQDEAAMDALKNALPNCYVSTQGVTFG